MRLVLAASLAAGALNATVLSLSIGILTTVLSVVGVWVAVRMNRRDAEREAHADMDRAVTAARAPLIAENARLSGELAAAKLRVDKLEDRLWRLGERE